MLRRYSQLLRDIITERVIEVETIKPPAALPATT